MEQIRLKEILFSIFIVIAQCIYFIVLSLRSDYYIEVALSFYLVCQLNSIYLKYISNISKTFADIYKYVVDHDCYILYKDHLLIDNIYSKFYTIDIITAADKEIDEIDNMTIAKDLLKTSIITILLTTISFSLFVYIHVFLNSDINIIIKILLILFMAVISILTYLSINNFIKEDRNRLEEKREYYHELKKLIEVNDK